MQSIGIDIEKVSRFKKGKVKSSFLQRLYTAKELHYCFSKTNPAEHLAGRFAAKESVIKALALFDKRPLDHKNIEITNDKFGLPSVSLKNHRSRKYGFLLSISHTKDVAIALVVVNSK